MLRPQGVREPPGSVATAAGSWFVLDSHVGSLESLPRLIPGQKLCAAEAEAERLCRKIGLWLCPQNKVRTGLIAEVWEMRE